MHDIVRKVIEEDEVREQCMLTCRRIVRLSKRVVAEVHSGGDPSDAAEEMMALTRELGEIAPQHPWVYHSGAVENALQEAAEAVIFEALVRRGSLPETDFPPHIYLMGVCDALGELRRYILNLLMAGKHGDAREYAVLMESMYRELSRVSLPGMPSGLRRKVDTLRALTDRTLSDVLHTAGR